MSLINLRWSGKIWTTIIQSRCLSVAVKPRDPVVGTDDFFKQEFKELDTYFPEVVQTLCQKDFVQKFPGISERYEKLFSYITNTRDLKRLSTAMLTLYTYKNMEKPENLTPENLRKACFLSWAYRLVESSKIIVDDIADNSPTRYLKPTWHTLEGVSNALFDSYFFDTAAYLILYKELADHPQLLNIIRLFKESTFRYYVAQGVDQSKVPFERSSEFIECRMEKGYYVMDTPVRTGMYMANISDPHLHDTVRKVTQPAGAFAVVQNDYWEVFAPYSQFKKRGTDISAGTNTWLLGKALELGSPEQIKIIEDNYGKSDEESIGKVLEVYQDLKLDRVYKETENNCLEGLAKKIHEFPEELPRNFFLDALQIFQNGYLNG